MDKNRAGKTPQFAFLAFMLALLMLFLTIEGGFRIYAWVNDSHEPRSILPPEDTQIPDSEWGWRTKSNYFFEGELKDFSGAAYNARVSTDHRGFRTYEESPEDTQKRVLFIGDSFTLGNQLSDEDLYYALIGDSLSLAVYAYGLSGSGNYQQYLILDEMLDAISPDLVVWQLCANDFIDNYWPLELDCWCLLPSCFSGIPGMLKNMRASWPQKM